MHDRSGVDARPAIGILVVHRSPLIRIGLHAALCLPDAPTAKVYETDSLSGAIRLLSKNELRIDVVLLEDAHDTVATVIAELSLYCPRSAFILLTDRWTNDVDRLDVPDAVRARIGAGVSARDIIDTIVRVTRSDVRSPVINRSHSAVWQAIDLAAARAEKPSVILIHRDWLLRRSVRTLLHEQYDGRLEVIEIEGWDDANFRSTFVTTTPIAVLADFDHYDGPVRRVELSRRWPDAAIGGLCEIRSRPGDRWSRQRSLERCISGDMRPDVVIAEFEHLISTRDLPESTPKRAAAVARQRQPELLH